MKVLVEVSDKDSRFGMKVLKNLSFIRKTSPLPASSLSLFRDLNEASRDIKMHKAGKLKLQTARELLDEL
jgi:hypothetical protein